MDIKSPIREMPIALMMPNLRFITGVSTWVKSWPVFWKALSLGTMFTFVTVIVPPIVFIGTYERSDDVYGPIGGNMTLELSVTLINNSLATVPMTFFWLWFPGECRKFVEQFRRVSSGDFEEPSIRPGIVAWAIIILIVTGGVGGFTWGIFHDSINEWFEVSTIPWNLGFGFKMVWIAAHAIVFGYTSIQVLHFALWLRRRSNSPIIVQELHPDGKGGLGFAGSTIAWLTIICTIFGFWSAWNQFALFFRNNQIAPFGPTPLSEAIQVTPVALIVNAVLLISVYIFLIVISLYMPSRAIHNAMLKARGVRLSDVSEKFEEARQDWGKGILERGELVRVLKNEFDDTIRTFPTRPFSLIALRGLRALSFLPMISVLSLLIGIVTLLMDIITLP